MVTTSADRSIANVLDFGADPTGVTASTDAFQAAINTGLLVMVPPGTFIVGNLTGIRAITGAGEKLTTVKAATGTTGNFLSLAGPNAVIEAMTIDLNGCSATIYTASAVRAKYRRLTIKNGSGFLWVTGAATDAVIEDVTCIGLTGVYALIADAPGVEVRRCVIDGCSPTSALLQVGSDATVTRCVIRNVGATTRPGVYVFGSRSEVESCRIDMTGSTSTVLGLLNATGVLVRGSDNRISRNYIRGCNVCGIVIANGSKYCVIEGNRIQDCATNGILTAQAAPDLTGGGHTVTGNVVTGITGGNGALGQMDVGIEVQSPNTTVTGNTVMECANHGVYTSAPGTVITGNVIAECAVTGTPGGSTHVAAGIAVQSSHNIISGNLLCNNGSSGGEGNGIQITASGGLSPSGNVITGNRATDTRTPKYQSYGLWIAETAPDTVTGTTVHDNDWTGCINETLIAAADPFRAVQAGNAGWVLREAVTAPVAPPANAATIFARDSGSGKTQIAVRFATGAVQTIATEP